MSPRAAQMLKEDMELMGPIEIMDVRKSQERIIQIIYHLEHTGEIIVPFSKGETVE
jgi:flagellar motor switch protein FliG